MSIATYGPGTVLGIRDTLVSETEKNPCPREANILLRRRE